MITARNPHAMTPEERLAEIGEILARAFMRLLDCRETCPDVAPGAQDSLAVPAESTAPCDPGSQSHSTEEVA